jgi:hypothetical protein
MVPCGTAKLTVCPAVSVASLAAAEAFSSAFASGQVQAFSQALASADASTARKVGCPS